jgi:hypothetical protein
VRHGAVAVLRFFIAQGIDWATVHTDSKLLADLLPPEPSDTTL